MLGLAPTPAAGTPASTSTDHRPTRCGPTTERARTEPTRLSGKLPRAHEGLDSLGASPSRRRHPTGVELVRQESPARRNGEVSEASRPTRDSAHREWRWGPDLVRLFGAARLDPAGHRMREPSRCCNRRGPRRGRIKNSTRRRSSRRPSIAVFIQAAEAIRRFGGPPLRRPFVLALACERPARTPSRTNLSPL